MPDLHRVRWLPFFLLLVPLIEIYLFIEVGSRIGFLATLGLCILTAVLGSWIVRAQGFSLLSRMQSDLNRGDVPAGAVAEGALVSFAGMLLILPGFFTDACGFLLLIPFVRRALIARLGRHFHVVQPQGRDGFDGVTIDGEAHEVTPGETKPANPDSPRLR